MDFANRNLWVLFKWRDETVYVTESLLSAWVIMAVLITFAIIVRIRLSYFKSVPGKFQNIIEALVETMSNFTKNTMGEKLESFGGYFFSIFSFILLSNYSSLIGLRPPTSDFAVTAALAVSTFVMTHITGAVMRRGKYLKDYLSPNPLFLPLNIIGELAKPVSLSFRLFGNMLGGVIIIGLVYEMLPIALRFVFPDILHIYFDIFVGALQAFIFTVLSMTFIQQKSVADN